jgi:hypothetical protein
MWMSKLETPMYCLHNVLRCVHALIYGKLAVLQPEGIGSSGSSFRMNGEYSFHGQDL